MSACHPRLSHTTSRLHQSFHCPGASQPCTARTGYRTVHAPVPLTHKSPELRRVRAARLFMLFLGSVAAMPSMQIATSCQCPLLLRQTVVAQSLLPDEMEISKDLSRMTSAQGAMQVDVAFPNAFGTQQLPATRWPSNDAARHVGSLPLSEGRWLYRMPASTRACRCFL